jgi:uncharacterized membrane protein
MNRWLLVSILLTVVVAAATLYLNFVRPDLFPAEVPTHWNAASEVDARVPRERMLPYLMIGPGWMVFVVALSLVLPWLSPRNFDVDRFRNTFFYLMMLVVVLFAYIQASLLLAMMGKVSDIGALFGAGMFLFFALFGNMMGKVKRNFWMGVRTPWTLADETVWNRTHRMTAWLWVPGGLLGFIAILAGLPALAALPILLLLALAPVPYSLILYKRLEKQGKLSAASGGELPPE